MCIKWDDVWQQTRRRRATGVLCIAINICCGSGLGLFQVFCEICAMNNRTNRPRYTHEIYGHQDEKCVAIQARWYLDQNGYYFWLRISISEYTGSQLFADIQQIVEVSAWVPVSIQALTLIRCKYTFHNDNFPIRQRLLKTYMIHLTEATPLNALYLVQNRD